MSVHKKVLFIGSLIILMTAGAFFMKGLAQYNSEINFRTKIIENQHEEVLSDLHEYLFEAYHLRIKGFVELDKPLKESLIARNKEKALKISSRKYQVLKGENPYFSLLQFHLPDGSIFFRVKGQVKSSPEKRPMIEEARNTKKTIRGFEIGKDGCLYRLVYPVFDKDIYIGALEFGIKTKQIINPLKEKLNSEVAVYFLSSEWEKATDHPKCPLVHFGEYTLVTHNDKIYELISDQIISIDIDPDNPAEYHKEISFDGKTYIAHLAPIIKNFRGEIFGGTIILQDMTSILERKREYILHTVLLTAAIMIVSWMALYATIKSLVGTLEHTKIELEKFNTQLNDEVDKRKKAEQALRELSIKDELTGLYNRRYFSQEVLTHAFNCLCRHNSNYVCLMIDLDEFKQVNDEYGHIFGDHVLKEFAKLLEGNIRNVDIASRYGGEEFVVILTDSSLEEGVSTAERIRKSAEEHLYQQDGISAKVTTSIGIASFFDHISKGAGEQIAHEASYKLVTYADNAMYSAKRSGKNRVVVYEKNM